MDARSIDEKAKKDFETIIRFSKKEIWGRREGIPGHYSKAHANAENAAINYLVKSFIIVAKCYFAKACEIIQATNGEIYKDNIHKRNREYYGILRRLVEHARFLTDLTPATYPYWSKREQIEDLISAIITRFPENREKNARTLTKFDPLFIILINPEFKYIRLNYVPVDTLVLGMPPSIFPESSSQADVQNLGILWHEIGGHAVVLAEKKKKFQNWIAQWGSKGETVLEKLEVLYEHATEPRERSLTKNWRIIWLAEFFEDLFGVQALGGTMVKALAHALTQHYSDLSRSDKEHPPPNLRLKVALTFLKKDDPEAYKSLDKIFREPREGADPFMLRKVGDEANEIAEFFLTNAEEFSSKTLGGPERIIADALRNKESIEFDKLLKKATAPGIAERDYHELHDIYESRLKKISTLSSRASRLLNPCIEAPAENNAGESLDKLLTALEESSKKAKHIEPLKSLIKKIREAPDLKTLRRKVLFAEIDRGSVYDWDDEG